MPVLLLSRGPGEVPSPAPLGNETAFQPLHLAESPHRRTSGSTGSRKLRSVVACPAVWRSASEVAAWAVLW